MMSIQLLAHGPLGGHPGCARLDPLVPRVMKLCVTRSSAVSKPRTAATTATHFTRFLDGAAFGTYNTDYYRPDCWCAILSSVNNTNRRTLKFTVWSYMPLSLKLTFAGLQSFKPPVRNVFVPGTSTVLKPSTTRSATAFFTGFLECATLLARPLTRDR